MENFNIFLDRIFSRLDQKCSFCNFEIFDIFENFGFL